MALRVMKDGEEVKRLAGQQLGLSDNQGVVQDADSLADRPATWPADEAGEPGGFQAALEHHLRERIDGGGMAVVLAHEAGHVGEAQRWRQVLLPLEGEKVLLGVFQQVQAVAYPP